MNEAPTTLPLAAGEAAPTKRFYDRYWDEGSAVYSGSQQGYAQNFRQWMRDELSAQPRCCRILEVGCGDGTFTRNLADYSAHVVALDLSASQIERNARLYPLIDFRQHDLANPLPFRNETFDVIWCSEVLEHLFDPAFAVQEIYRVLAPGGKMLVTVPYHGRFKNVLIALFKWDEHFSPGNPHIRFFTKRTLGDITREAGFDRITMRTCGMNQPLRDLFVPTNLLLRAVKDYAAS